MPFLLSPLRPVRAGFAIAVVLLTAACSTGPVPVVAPEPSPSPLLAVESLAVIGDSMSLGVNACSGPGECHEASWAFGTEPAVMSLVARFEQSTGVEPSTTIASKDGANVSEALAMIDEVVAASPDLVAIEIGGNDACTADFATMTSAADYRAHLSDIVAQIAAALPDAVILVLSVPDLYHLWDISHGIPAATRTWDGSVSCRSLLQDPGATDAAAEQRRQTVRGLVDEYNAAIVDVCEQTANCIHDGGALNDYRFAESDISSLDYFHPSILGQRAIAEIAWAAIEGSDRIATTR